MNLFHDFDIRADLVGWGVNVLYLAAPMASGVEVTAHRIAGIGGQVEMARETFEALEALIGDPLGWQLFVIDCDGIGGLTGGQRAVAMLRAAGVRVPVMLISRDCETQIFPDNPQEPVLLRAPLSAVSLRVGFEHALRDKGVYRRAA